VLIHFLLALSRLNLYSQSVYYAADVHDFSFSFSNKSYCETDTV